MQNPEGNPLMARPPKPTALKVLQGTAQPCRVNKQEPTPPITAKAETPPACLTDPIALDLWTEHIAGLIATRVMTDADRSALALTCQAWAEYWRADEDIRKGGATYLSEKERGGGMIERARPQVDMRKDAWRRAQVGLGYFGLNPSARSGVKAEQPSADSDPIKQYLAQQAARQARRQAR